MFGGAEELGGVAGVAVLELLPGKRYQETYVLSERCCGVKGLYATEVLEGAAKVFAFAVFRVGMSAGVFRSFLGGFFGRRHGKLYDADSPLKGCEVARACLFSG
jgi:hypothetical protein